MNVEIARPRDSGEHWEAGENTGLWDGCKTLSKPRPRPPPLTVHSRRREEATGQDSLQLRFLPPSPPHPPPTANQYHSRRGHERPGQGCHPSCQPGTHPQGAPASSGPLAPGLRAPLDTLSLLSLAVWGGGSRSSQFHPQPVCESLGHRGRPGLLWPLTSLPGMLGQTVKSAPLPGAPLPHRALGAGCGRHRHSSPLPGFWGLAGQGRTRDWSASLRNVHVVPSRR